MKKLSLTLSLVVLGALAGCSTPSSGDPAGSGAVELPEQERVSPPGASTGGGGAAPVKAGDAMTPADQYKLPAWDREDVQPRSARFGETYGLAAYQGKTVVVVLLEGYCPYCQSNSLVAQQLQDQLTSEKLDVQIVVLGDLNAAQFASKVSLPIFKDGDGNAWEAMRPNASKHDTFVFGPDGKRTYFWLGSYQGDATRWRAEVGAAVREVAKPAP